MPVYALDAGAQLAQEVDNGTAAEARQIGHIRAERPAGGAKTGYIQTTWLIDENPIDGIGSQAVLNFFEEPGTKGLMIETGGVVIAPMAIHHARVRVPEGIPARHERWPGEQVAITAKAQVDLQADILCQPQTTFKVTTLALLLLLINGIDDASCTRGSDAVKIALHRLWVKQGVKISDSYVHSDYHLIVIAGNSIADTNMRQNLYVPLEQSIP